MATRNNHKEKLSDDEKSIIQQNIGELKDKHSLNDNMLAQNDSSSLSKHNDEYSRLLKGYVDNFIDIRKKKYNSGAVLFWVSIVLLIVITIASLGILSAGMYCFSKEENSLSIVISVVGIIVEFVSVYMAIPKIIASYLYNPDEEKYLTDIIGKIQDYDMHIRDKSI